MTRTQMKDDALLLNALADGELDAGRAFDLERRIAREPVLAKEYDRIRAIKEVVTRAGRASVSSDFSARIAALNPNVVPFAPRRARLTMGFSSGAASLMAASFALTAGLASLLTYATMSASPLKATEDSIVAAHRRALIAGSPIDIASSDRHTVRPWFDNKLGLSPPTPDLAKQGFALVGGRVEVIGHKPVPSLVYKHNEHLISVVAEPQTQARSGDETPMYDVDDGYNVAHWSGQGFSYWAVSDLDPGELKTFVADLRAQ